MIPDINKPSIDLLIDLINDRNASVLPFPLDVNMVTFEAPEVCDPPAPQNTNVVMQFTEAFPFPSSPVSLNYDRLDLGVLFGGALLDFEDTALVFNTIYDLYDAIQARFGVTLTDADLEEVIFPDRSEAAYPYAITLAARPDSLLFIGQTTARLVQPADAIPAGFIHFTQVMYDIRLKDVGGFDFLEPISVVGDVWTFADGVVVSIVDNKIVVSTEYLSKVVFVRVLEPIGSDNDGNNGYLRVLTNEPYDYRSATDLYGLNGPDLLHFDEIHYLQFSEAIGCMAFGMPDFGTYTFDVYFHEYSEI